MSEIGEADRCNKPPIFLVGAPRSGTTLLAAMMAAHSRLSCGPETRFFRFLAHADSDALCDPQTWPEAAVDFLFSLILVDVPVPEHFGLSREDLYGYLSQHVPTVSAMLSSLTESLMQRDGKMRWIEKSPEHLKYVQELRNTFPESPIVRIVRDPRDVALSLVKTPWGPQSFLEALLFWCTYDEVSSNFFHSDQNCYTLKYENLLQSPEVELRRLCAFVGESYEAEMLDTSSSAASVVTEKDEWHRIVHKPIDKTRIGVWEDTLAEEQKRLAAAILGDRLSSYGYEYPEMFRRSAAVYPSLDAMLKHREILSSLVEVGTRFWQSPKDRRTDLIVYVEEPNEERWLSFERWARLRDMLRIMFRVMKSRFSRQEICWIRDRASRRGSGRSGRVLAMMFHLAGADQTN